LHQLQCWALWAWRGSDGLRRVQRRRILPHLGGLWHHPVRQREICGGRSHVVHAVLGRDVPGHDPAILLQSLPRRLLLRYHVPQGRLWHLPRWKILGNGSHGLHHLRVGYFRERVGVSRVPHLPGRLHLPRHWPRERDGVPGRDILSPRSLRVHQLHGGGVCSDCGHLSVHCVYQWADLPAGWARIADGGVPRGDVRRCGFIILFGVFRGNLCTQG